MTSPNIKRKLAAILSADVEGYSRLMGADEIFTVRTLTVYRELMSALILQYHGRVVDFPGDNLLAEFPSVVDAVQCAVDIQKILTEKNNELPENQRMHFRIGVNLGDVIEEDDRIFGDGVNIAARVEGLAEAGGICITGSAYEQIENKLALGYEYIGEHAVKNISKPIRVYRVPIGPENQERRSGKVRERKWRRAWHAFIVLLLVLACAALIRHFYIRSGPSPDTGLISGEASPSIAVLPFVNMSGDPRQEYFSDGITENIITGLSKSPMLLVIGRNSSFAYKGRAVNIQQVGRELGVQYVLEGSIQRSDHKVRVNAQLIDAISGQHQWAERYDRDLKDLFALQDEITMEIVSALHVKLTGHERARILAEGTENLDAYLKLLKGFALLRSRSPEDTLKAGKIAEEVIAMDPDYPKGYILLAMSLTRDAWHKKLVSTSEALDRAFELAQKALAMDHSLIGGYLVLGNIYLMRKEHDKAIAELEKAAAMNPNAFEVIAELGKALLWSGRSRESISLFVKAIRLNPVDAHNYELMLAKAYRIIGEYEKAIPIFERVAQKDSDRIGVRLELIACYTALGKRKQADIYVDEVLKEKPGFSVEKFVNNLPYRDEEMKSRFTALLRKAGLP